MSANVSSLPLPYSFMSICFSSRGGSMLFLTFTIANILLLFPVFIFILHLGHRRRRQHRSASTSHADVFTYHMVVMEMIFILASVIYCIGVHSVLPTVMITASHLVFSTSCGQMSFHLLTCVERYLAVVHPITYMHLKKGSGVRIRNVITLCVWLLSFAQISFTAMPSIRGRLLPYLLQVAFCLSVVSLCSVSVLRALMRPAPGEGGGDKDRVDQSKRRAFNTIMAIMGTLVLKFGTSLICTILYTVPQMNINILCTTTELSFWLGLPSSLVLPLLFLHRAGKLPCLRGNTDPEQGSP